MSSPDGSDGRAARPSHHARKPLHKRLLKNTLGRWASWGADPSLSSSRQPAELGSTNQELQQQQQLQQQRRGRSAGSDVELSNLNYSSSPSLSTAGATSDATAPEAELLSGPSTAPGSVVEGARPTGSLSHKSSANSLCGGLNDSSSVTSGSAAHFRHSSVPAGSDDLCSVATQIGSAPHSFNSLQSMVTTHGDASSDAGGAGPLAPSALAVAAVAAGGSGPASPTGGSAAGTAAITPLPSYRGSDAGGDATSVSTLPLISETGFDDQLLEAQTLTEEPEQEGGPAESDGGVPDQISESDHPLQHRPRVSSSHGSYTSFTSNTSDLSASGLAGARIPSPAHTRALHTGQRSSSRHSFQQQQALQDLEETQEEALSFPQEGGSVCRSLPVPFSTRRRPDNDDTCSYATQAGSSVHSISSVMSYLERQQVSNDGSAVTGNRSFSNLQQRHLQQQHQHGVSHPLQQQQQLEGNTDLSHGPSRSNSGSRQAQQQHQQQQKLPMESSQGANQQQATAGPFATAAAIAAAADAADQAPHAGGAAAAEAVDGHAGGAAAAEAVDGQTAEDGGSAHLQRKGSLKGAFKAVTRWGSGISQRLQRAGSSGSHQQSKKQHRQQQQQQQVEQPPPWSSSAGTPPPPQQQQQQVTASSSSQEMVGIGAALPES